MAHTLSKLLNIRSIQSYKCTRWGQKIIIVGYSGKVKIVKLT